MSDNPHLMLSDGIDLVGHCSTRWRIQTDLGDEDKHDCVRIGIVDLAATNWCPRVRLSELSASASESLHIKLTGKAELHQFAQGFRWLADRLEAAAKAAEAWRERT